MCCIQIYYNVYTVKYVCTKNYTVILRIFKFMNENVEKMFLVNDHILNGTYVSDALPLRHF